MQMNSSAFPQLDTPCSTSLNFLEQHFRNKRSQISGWFQKQWEKTPAPVYGSVDLRNAGFKLAPVDMNLFPAGFNNLNPKYFSISVLAARQTIQKLMPQAKKILVIPESHTRNILYWENIKTLQNILEAGGFTVKLGVLENEIKSSQTIQLNNGDSISIAPLVREHDQLRVDSFYPDMILLNNDLSVGIPDILQDLKLPLIPPAELGWSQRLKSEHFQYYAAVTDEFSAYIDIDPWLIAPLFKHCGQIDFMEKEGLECLIYNTEILFASIKNKYDEYHIPYQPFLVVKADAGTYGMAVMTVRNVDELKTLNRKQRTKMSVTKGGQPVRRVIIQEGVYTFETIGDENAVAEPVVYLWGEHVVGGFYRVHKDRGTDENLNAPGMRFEPLAFPQPCNEPCLEENNPDQNRFYAYGIVAQLSMLAAAREIKNLFGSLVNKS